MEFGKNYVKIRIGDLLKQTKQATYICLSYILKSTKKLIKYVLWKF